MIGRLAALMLVGSALLPGPALLSAQTGPDLLDAPPAELPPCRAPLQGVCYEFTSSTEGWHVPGWSLSAPGHARPTGPVIHVVAGDGALRIEADFPPQRWRAAVLELREIRNLDVFQSLVARVRVHGEGEFLVRWAAVLGSRWAWFEAPDATPIREGEWTDVSIPVASLGANLAHVRRLILRVESTGIGGSDEPVAVDFDYIRFVVSGEGPVSFDPPRR